MVRLIAPMGRSRMNVLAVQRVKPSEILIITTEQNKSKSVNVKNIRFFWIK